jgi:hypothetical protein
MRAPMTPARQHREGSPEPAVVDALVEALFDDPFYQSITIDFAADPAQRKLALGRYLAYSMDEAVRMGVCLVAPGPAAGAAIWTKPASAAAQQAESAAKSRYLATIGPRTGIATTIASSNSWPRLPSGWCHPRPVPVDRGIRPPRAVAPARICLLPTLAQAREPVACFLETFTPRNLPFYERLGFRALAAPRADDRLACVLMRGAGPAADRSDIEAGLLSAPVLA